MDEFADASAAYYLSTEAEAVPPGSVSAATVGSSSDRCRDLTTVAEQDEEFISCEANGEPETCKTVGDLTTEKASALEPLFIRHGVDTSTRTATSTA